MSRVIVTGAEHPAGLAVLRALRQAGHEPWAAVSTSGSYGARSRACAGTVHVPDPRADPAGFVDVLAHHARATGAEVVLPGTEAALLALSRGRAAFDPEVRVGVPDSATVVHALDKEAVAEDAVAAGFAVPPTVAVGPGVELSDGDGGFLPGVVKPIRSELVRADGRLERFEAVRVVSVAELRAAVAALPGSCGLLQPYLDGAFRTVNGLAWDGEVVTTVHKIADRTWPADCGVVSYARTVAVQPAIEEAARGLMRRLRWSGLFNVQMIEVAGRAHVIDVNPRPYHSLALATAAGVNLPALWVDMLLGRLVRGRGYLVGTRFRAEEDIRSVVALARSGGLPAAVRAALPRPGTVHPVLSARDPGPALALVGRAVDVVRRRVAERGDAGPPGSVPDVSVR